MGVESGLRYLRSWFAEPHLDGGVNKILLEEFCRAPMRARAFVSCVERGRGCLDQRRHCYYSKAVP
jgi:hypothetical protein